MTGGPAFTSTGKPATFVDKSSAEKNLPVPLDKHEVCSIFVHHENLDLNHRRSNRLNAPAKTATRSESYCRGLSIWRSSKMLLALMPPAGVATRKSFFPSFVTAGHTGDANHSGPGHDRSVKSPLPAPPDFWTPIFRVCDFLDDNAYRIDAEFFVGGQLSPASSGLIRMIAVMKDVTSASSDLERRRGG